MVQRYVKFGNFRSPVAASFAALQKVRSAPPVTGFLSSTFCCSLSAVRCSLFAARRSPLVACAYCSPAACHSLLSARRLPPATAARHHSSPPANSRRAGRFLSGKPVFVRICAESAAYVCRKEINVILFGFRRCRNGIFVYICTKNKGKQLFIPLANRGNFIRRLFEPGMGVVSTVLCLDLRIGAGTGTGRFSCSGSLKPALRGTDLRFFAGNKAARSLFRGGVRRCITVGISDEIPVLPSRLDFRGGGCDLGVTDNILPGGFLFLPFVSERRVYRGVTQERSPTGVPSAAPFFRGRADGQYVTTY